jgi:hypothetical protein
VNCELKDLELESYDLWNMRDNIKIGFYHFAKLLHRFSGPLYVTLGTDDHPKAEIAYKYGHNGIGKIWEETCKFDTKCFFGKVKYAEKRSRHLGVLNYWHTMLYRDRLAQMIKQKYYPELLRQQQSVAPLLSTDSWLQVFN